MVESIKLNLFVLPPIHSRATNALRHQNKTGMNLIMMISDMHVQQNVTSFDVIFCKMLSTLNQRTPLENMNNHNLIFWRHLPISISSFTKSVHVLINHLDIRANIFVPSSYDECVYTENVLHTFWLIYTSRWVYARAIASQFNHMYSSGNTSSIYRI